MLYKSYFSSSLQTEIEKYMVFKFTYKTEKKTMRRYMELIMPRAFILRLPVFIYVTSINRNLRNLLKVTT